MPLFNPNPIFLLTDLKTSITMSKNLINPSIPEGGAIMSNHRLFLVSSFLLFLFFTDAGYTETETDQPPP